MKSLAAPETLAFIGTVDLFGLLRGKSIPWSALERRMGRGVGLSPPLVLGSPFGPAREPAFGAAGELVLVPDPATRASIPAVDAPDLVVLLGDLLELDGAPWECCPRYFLRRGLAALHAEFGLTLQAAFEQEMVYTGATTRPGQPHSFEALRRQGGFGGSLLAAMRGNGIVPDKFLAAAGLGQFEVAAAPAPGVTAADQAVLVRELARAVAARLGHAAVLAPGATPEGVGSAAPIHWSLLDEFGQPAMYDEGGAMGLSDEAEHMAAGVLHHLRAIMAVLAPSGASYVRLRPGRLGKLTTELGGADRQGPVRLCPVSATAEEPAAAQLHFECRVSDASANPYLALGALVWAGLDGLRRQRRLADGERAALPGTLEAALDEFEESVPVAEWFGPALRETYSAAKRAECRVIAGMDEAQICARYAGLY